VRRSLGRSEDPSVLRYIESSGCRKASLSAIIDGPARMYGCLAYQACYRILAEKGY